MVAFNLGDSSGIGQLFSNNPGLVSGAGGPGGGGGFLGGITSSLFGDSLPYQGPQTSIADTAGSYGQTLFGEGQELLQPLLTGQLPPGAQAAVDLAEKNAETTSASKYSQLGLAGSTMSADATANLQQQKAAMQFQIAQQMAQTGLQASQQSLGFLGLDAKIYGGLMDAQMKQDTAMMQTIGQFAGAFGKAFTGVDFSKFFGSGAGGATGGGSGGGDGGSTSDAGMFGG